MKQEIEKRYILKNIPKFNQKDVIETLDIEQYYYFQDNIWKRLRYIHSVDDYLISDYYLHTIKHYIDGKTFEEETIIKFSEGKNLLDKIKNGHFKSKFLQKKRTIINTYNEEIFEENEIKGLKWEIDEIFYPKPKVNDINGYKINKFIIAEMEIPKEDYKIDNTLIYNDIIMEITGIKEYSNFSLASTMNF